jgi:hypothetical protein
MLPTCVFRFLKVLDCEDKILEYNQEACRIHSYDGKKSLIRSFPVRHAFTIDVCTRGADSFACFVSQSKVGVSDAPFEPGCMGGMVREHRVCLHII